MSGGGGGTGIGFIDDTVDKVSNAAKDTWGSIEDDPLMALGTLGLFSGATQLVAAPLQTTSTTRPRATPRRKPLAPRPPAPPPSPPCPRTRPSRRSRASAALPAAVAAPS